MDITFVRINGVYICPKCGEEHDISGDYETDEDRGMYDSGKSIECCGIGFEMIFDFR